MKRDSKYTRLAFLIRSFLQENKIFFEVLVATSLSFMAIYVSIQANRIAEIQTVIMEQENMPQIEVKMKQEINDSTKISDHTILIFNRGGKLTNFDIRTYSFIKIDLKRNYSDTASVTIPVDNYWDPYIKLTGDSEDLICWFDNTQSNVKLMQLRDSLQNTAFLEVVSYSEISYTDLFDHAHTEYYQLEVSKKQISEEDWLANKDAYEKNKIYPFHRLSTNQIFNILKDRGLN